MKNTQRTNPTQHTDVHIQRRQRDEMNCFFFLYLTAGVAHINTNKYTHMDTHTHTVLYEHRERERERDKRNNASRVDEQRIQAGGQATEGGRQGRQKERGRWASCWIMCQRLCQVLLSVHAASSRTVLRHLHTV